VEPPIHANYTQCFNLSSRCPLKQRILLAIKAIENDQITIIKAAAAAYNATFNTKILHLCLDILRTYVDAVLNN